MALEPMSETKKNAIVKSIVNTIVKGNIELLTKQAYDFINLASGFIAHYNHSGFKYHYEDTEKFKADILAFKNQNQWANFSAGEQNYEYYMQKKEIYNMICAGITLNTEVI